MLTSTFCRSVIRSRAAPVSPYATTLAVLGIETTFASNSRYVLDVVDEAFGAWRTIEPIEDLRVTVRIIVSEGTEGIEEHAPVHYRLPDAERVIVAVTRQVVGMSDPARRESIAYVTTALAADRSHFRVTFLEALTFALLAHFDRHPLHAAAIARDGRAVLLVGESGAGKSTLAYLAASRGVRRPGRRPRMDPARHRSCECGEVRGAFDWERTRRHISRKWCRPACLRRSAERSSLPSTCHRDPAA